MTLEDLLDSSNPYCLDYDFEPDNAEPEERSWTHNEKWFMSNLAVADVEELICLN